MKYKKINQILPGDLICDISFRKELETPVLIISSIQNKVLFLLMGDDFLYEGVTTENEYFLLSRNV